MDGGLFSPPVADTDLDQDVFGCVLGVLDKHIEVAISVEDAGVQQLIFPIDTGEPLTGLDEVVVWKYPLRILIQVFHVRVSRGAIEVKVVFLDIFTVVALAVCESEQAFFEDGISTVPQRQAEAEKLPVVAETSEAILTPVISPRASLVVSEVSPGISILAVVLANRSPLPLGQVGPPLSPR